MNKQQLAEKMAQDKYMRAGYFGGRANIQSGKVVGIKYFDHKQAVEDSLKEIEKYPKIELR